MREHKCPCGESDPKNFYDKRYNLCKICEAITKRNILRKKKAELVEIFNYKCGICGYDEYQGSLDFHHLYGKDKNISKLLNSSYSKILHELKTCILVCANCHRKIHGGLIDDRVISEIYHRQNMGLMEKWNKLINKTKFRPYLYHHTEVKKIRMLIKCPVCCLYFRQSTDRQIYCSYNCYKKSLRRYRWPTREELEKLVWKKPATHIAKDFGVSDKAIKNLCKKYGIDKPFRGYWAKLRANKLTTETKCYQEIPL